VIRPWQRSAASPLLRGGRAAARRRCAEWILAHQDQDGSWGQCAQPSALSLAALRVAGYPPEHPALARGLAWLDRLVTFEPDPAGRVIRRQASECAVTQTAQAMTALAEAGLRPDDPAMARAAAWLEPQEIRWPDIPASKAMLLALPRAAGRPRGKVGAAPAAAAAAAVAALSAAGLAGSWAARRGVIWLLRAQEADGSWSGGRDAGATSVTSAVVEALIAAGVVPGKPPVRRAVRWLVGSQNGDGGWADQPGAAGADSTAVATAGAVLALTSAGGSDAGDSAGLGIRWLARCQRPDGDWDAERDEPERPDTALIGSPRRPRLSRLCCPIRALGRYLSGVR
jgi:squalene-hopene/tetraprenyl-beta-curcumene cyclase